MCPDIVLGGKSVIVTLYTHYLSYEKKEMNEKSVHKALSEGLTLGSPEKLPEKTAPPSSKDCKADRCRQEEPVSGKPSSGHKDQRAHCGQNEQDRAPNTGKR